MAMIARNREVNLTPNVPSIYSDDFNYAWESANVFFADIVSSKGITADGFATTYYRYHTAAIARRRWEDYYATTWANMLTSAGKSAAEFISNNTPFTVQADGLSGQVAMDRNAASKITLALSTCFEMNLDPGIHGNLTELRKSLGI